jgi:hypothetical protein
MLSRNHTSSSDVSGASSRPNRCSSSGSSGRRLLIAQHAGGGLPPASRILNVKTGSRHQTAAAFWFVPQPAA